MGESRKHIVQLVAAFLAGAVIAAALVFIFNGQRKAPVQEGSSISQEAVTPEAAQAETSEEAQAGTSEEAQAGTSEGAQAEVSEAAQAGTSEEAQAGTSEGAQAEVSEAAQAETSEEAQAGTSEGAQTEVSEETQEETAASPAETDFAETFPSWEADSASLKELVDFVTDTADPASPGYLDPEDRIAVFDMDGTIISEKAPVYIDYCLTMYRVLDDPSYAATDEEMKAAQELRDHAHAEGKTYHPETFSKDDLIANAFAGMTPEEFRAYVVDFADHQDVVGFEGMTYGQSFYKPMVEVIAYLKANDFDVWMVSACEREVVRALVERFDIPYDHVIATDVPYLASGKGDEAADDYNMGSDEEILLGAPLDSVECGKSGKPAAIAREIGKRPVLAFGNSSGDYSMLNYAEGNPYHEGMGFFVVCDDTEREYGSDEKAGEYYEKVEKEGWTAFSMADDWATIYGDDVVKTGLPEAEEALADAA